MQRSSQIDEPDYGHLLDNMMIADGASVPHANYCLPRVEVELAFVMGKPLRGPGVGLPDVLRATEYVVPAIEIVDARLQDPRKIFDTVSDNGAAAGIVIGGRPVGPLEVDLRWVGGIMYRNAEIEETGVAAGVLGHPALGVAWLANKLGQHGVTLEPGHLVLRRLLHSRGVCAQRRYPAPRLRHSRRHCGSVCLICSLPLSGGEKKSRGETMSAAETVAAGDGSIDDVVARIERLPISPWHVKTRIIIGVATFFDAFDALTIAFVLPVLIPAWKLTGPQIGFLISAGYVGQLAGALFFGWMAERVGRVPAIVWSILIFAVMSLACAFAWDYGSLTFTRVIQGFGLGGEVPVAATYISELARAKGRGRFVLLYELVFPIGLVATGLAGSWIVPRFGWQWMFVIGAVPALVAFFVQRLLPESPRWLASRGRTAQAQAALSFIERATKSSTGRPLPAPQPVARGVQRAASWSDLFGPTYLRRTLVVWTIWFSAYFFNYGLVVWLPTIYSTVFKLPLQQSLQYGLITQAVGLCGALTCALTIDRVGRRPWFALAFAVNAIMRHAWRAGPARAGFAGAGAGVRVERLFLRLGAVDRRLRLYARALSDARPRHRGRDGDRVAALCLDPRSRHRRADRRRRACARVSRLRLGRCCWSGCHRPVRGGDERARPRGDFAVALPTRCRTV